jgi:thiol:disulfide interchange protein DsbD
MAATYAILAGAWLWILGPAAAHADFAVPKTAVTRGIVVDGKPQVEIRLLVDAAELRPGDALRVGVLFELESGWHIYWRNPGQAGLPTEIDWKLEDATPGPLQWPAPEIFHEGEGSLTTYGYAEQVLFFAPARLSEAAEGRIEIVAEVDYLACEVECIPGEASLRRTLPVADETKPAEDAVLELFQSYAERIPAPPEGFDLEIELLYSQSKIRPDDEFRAAIALIACPDHLEHDEDCPAVRAASRKAEDVFAPERNPWVKIETTDSRPHPRLPTGWLVTLQGRAARDDPGDNPRLAGVLALERGDGTPIWVAIDEPLPSAPRGTDVTRLEHPWLAPRAQAAVAPGLPLWQAIALALVGGLILNLMPCVLPVLAIKVFGLTQLAHEGRRKVLLHGFMYAAGTILTMLGLAVIVITLKAAGTRVGWGFQFQEPLFVATISAVLLVFALNLFGVFEIYAHGGRLAELGMHSVGLRRSFLEGLLAVIVATPCSAPFLGTAVGFALASPAGVILSVFAAIGLGLALPYVLITLLPGWGLLLPRSGPWTRVLQVLLGFGLVGTVVWLLWLTGRSAGVDAMTGLLVFLVVVASATWLYGASQGAAGAHRLIALGLAAVMVTSAGFLTLRFKGETSGPNGSGSQGLGWQPFDPAHISAVLQSGRPVFVDFTADWCITCGVNEKLVIESASVLRAFERLNIATFKADWTRRDETIRAELARYGRAGVPMYLVYSPAAPEDPIVLPELLTIDRVLDALHKASESVASRPKPKM